MTLQRWSFEGGTEGAQVTTAAVGTDPGFAAVFYNNVSYPSGNAAIVYKASAALIGSMGVEMTLGAGSTYLRADEPAPGNRAGVRFPIIVAASPPSATTPLAAIRNASSQAALAQLDTSNRVAAYNATGTTLTASRYTFTAAGVYWGVLVATKGTTTTDGRIELYVYDTDGTTQLWYYDSGTTVNAGTLNTWQFRWPHGTSASGQPVMKIDGIACDGDLVSGSISAPPSNSPPTCTLAASETADVEPGRLITLTATTSDSDGTSSITDLSQISGSPTMPLTALGGDQWTFIAPATLAGTTLVFRATATDNDAATTTADATVAVLPASVRIGGDTPAIIITG